MRLSSTSVYSPNITYPRCPPGLELGAVFVSTFILSLTLSLYLSLSLFTLCFVDLFIVFVFAFVFVFVSVCCPYFLAQPLYCLSLSLSTPSSKLFYRPVFHLRNLYCIVLYSANSGVNKDKDMVCQLLRGLWGFDSGYSPPSPWISLKSNWRGKFQTARPTFMER